MSNSPKSSMMTNTSGLRPLGIAVLVEPYETELVSKILHIPETARERSMMVEVHATVVAIGPEVHAVRKIEPGDKVLVSKWCGHITQGPADGRLYRMVNAEDIFCVIVKEAKSNG